MEEVEGSEGEEVDRELGAVVEVDCEDWEPMMACDG